MMKGAFATLLTRTSYLPGVLVLNYGLKSVKSRYPLLVLVTPALPQDARQVLKTLGIILHEVDTLRPEAERHTLSEHDARFADTWTKLR